MRIIALLLLILALASPAQAQSFGPGGPNFYIEPSVGSTSGGTCSTLSGDVTGTCAANTVQSVGGNSFALGGALVIANVPTVNNLLYVTSAGHLGPLATSNSGVLVTSAGGVPSISTTLPAGLTIPGYSSSTLTSAHLFVGNGSNAATDVAASGDLTLANTGAFTIANNAVTLAKLATQATNTVLGNATSGTAVPTALAVSSCSTASSALIWTTNTGFGCNTSITATTNANLTGPITSVGNATSIASQTGTGTKFVVDTSPTLVTPILGVAAGTSLALGGATIGSNGLAVTGHILLEGVTSTGATGTGAFVFGTAPTIAGGSITALTTFGIRDTSAAFDVTLAATSSTNLSAGRTLTLDVKNVAHTLALGSTANTITFPSASSYTVAGLSVDQTWTGTQTFGPVVGTINTQSGTTYTLAASDCGKTILFTSGSAITLTTLNSLSAGCAIAVEQGGAGQVTIANGSGATSHSAHSFTKTFAQYAIIGLFVDTNAGGTAADIIITGDGA